MIDFFSRVLSPKGLICIASPAEGAHWFRHFSVDTQAKANWVLEKLVSENKDVYFAIGTLKEKFIEIDGKKKIRVVQNISQIKSLILDLDVGPDKPYQTQAAAVKHLLQFIKETSLPNPILVSSGYGIHVYWPFTYAIETPLWQKLAAQFKALTIAYGLHADPSRTADASSVLRLPGSMNFKNPADPKPVVVLNKNPVRDTPPKDLTMAIVAASKKFNAVAQPVSSGPTPKVDTGLGSFDTALPPADFKEIIKRCPQIKAAASDQANTKEPVWQLVLQTAIHCENGEKFGHAVSFKHPKYTREETDAKMAGLIEKGYGATKCETFAARNPSGCAGCPHAGKINSPISLGRGIKEAAEKPTIVLDHGNGETSTVELPKPPYPYLRTSCGGIAMRVKDEDGNELAPSIIYKYDIHPIKRMFDEVEQCEVFVFRSWLPHEGWREYPIPAYMIYDERKLMETLARQGVMPNMDNKSRLVGYMLGYIQSLQEAIPAEQIYSQMGWRKADTEIVIGAKCFNANGVKAVKVNDQYKNVVKKFEAKGDLETWKAVANIYNRPGFEEYAFPLMMGFGQLFFKFTGYEGAIFNLYGDTGAGKSTVLKLIHSIYGTPTEKSLLHQDTNNAKFAVIGCYNNLPITYDEASNIDPAELSDLCYAVSNGRGKEALNSNRSLRENIATWQTTMYCSSNPPLIPKLINFKGTASGETHRMLERFVKALDTHTLTEARELLAPLETNYGLAGDVIAAWMVENFAEAKALMLDTYRAFGERVAAASPERFWVAMCAQAIVGAKIGNMLGLHTYSVDAITAHAVKIINDTRGGVASEVKSPVDVLVEYLNNHITDTLVTDVTRSGALDITRRPHRSLMILHEAAEGRIYITKSHLKSWCVENNHDAATMMRYLAARSILLSDNTSKCLGDGKEYITGRTPCYLIDARHPLMSGAAQLTAVPVKKTA